MKVFVLSKMHREQDDVSVVIYGIATSESSLDRLLQEHQQRRITGLNVTEVETDGSVCIEISRLRK